MAHSSSLLPNLEVLLHFFRKPNSADASQLCNTFHLKILRAQLVSCDYSIAILFTDQNAEQPQRTDPSSGVGQYDSKLLLVDPIGRLQCV